MLQRQASAIDTPPTNRTSLPNISRISIVRKALREIIKLVELKNSTGSSINLSIITFNDSATVYTMDSRLELDSKNFKHVVCSSFFNKLDIHPNGETNFISAIEAFEYVKTPNTISVFLSDGEHSGNRNDILDAKFSKQITYSVGVGSDNDSELLKWIGTNFLIGSNQKEIEEILIGSIFSSLNQIDSGIQVDIIVPSQIKLSSEVCTHQSPLNSMDVSSLEKDTIFEIDILASGENNILNIKPNSRISCAPVENMDLAFIIDISGSMDQFISNRQLNDFLEIDLKNQDEDPFNLQDLDIDDTVKNLPLDSVFNSNNHSQESEEIHSSPYTKYTFTIDKLEQFSDFKFEFKSMDSNLKSLEQIQIIITDQSNKKSGIIGLKTTSAEYIWIINQNILLINALKKISMCVSESVKKEYIRELNSWISSPEYNQKVLDIEATDSQQSQEYIKLSSIISQIKCLYKSIQTFGDLHFNYMRQFSMGDLARDISTQTCRTLTQQTSVRIVSNMTQNDGCLESSEDNTICCICMGAPRQVLFSCSHIVTCIDCYKKISVGVNNVDRCIGSESISTLNIDTNFTYGICPDNKCPVCRQEITSIRELNLTLGYKCKTTGCNSMPVIIDANCLSPVYCEPCWSSLIRKRKYSKTDIECYCETTCGITKYIKPKFV